MKEGLLFVFEEGLFEEEELPAPIIGHFEVQLHLEHVFVVEDVFFGLAEGRVAVQADAHMLIRL